MNSKSSKRERIATAVAATSPTVGGAVGGAIGALAGGPGGAAIGGAIGGIIPSLASIPATRRHRDRLQKAIAEVDRRLSIEQADLQKLNDEQFKLLNECVLTLTETVELGKIEYLKTIIVNSVSYSDYHSYESVLLSRIVRDISAEEIRFLIDNFSYKNVNIYSWSEEDQNDEKRSEDLRKLEQRIREEDGLLLLMNSPEALVVNGLVGLGILAPDAQAIGVYKYRFSSVSVKLLVLLNRRSQ